MEALADGFACGQVGTIFITIDDGEGNNVVGPTTANIVEIECSVDNVATYRYLGVFPPDPADSPYVITWEGENIGGVVVTASEEIEVSTEAPEIAPSFGPCSAWIDAEDVAECCASHTAGTDVSLLEPWVGPAVEVLHRLSGGIFTGLCGPVTVRPCGGCGGCSAQQRWRYTDGSIGVIWTGQDWSYQGRSSCSCGCVPEVELGRYDVQGIAQVKIDGEVIAPSAYRLDERYLLVRTDGLSWPSCQRIAADDDEEGTFSVSYWYGEQPTELAIAAASRLACEMFAACNAGSGRCQLPKGTRSVVRGGNVIEIGALIAESLKTGATGILVIDEFIATYGSRHEPSSVWSPDLPPAPRLVG
jgi:hypothetical protein